MTNTPFQNIIGGAKKIVDVGKEFLIPGRGFTDVEISESKPTLKEKGMGALRFGAEILQIPGTIGNLVGKGIGVDNPQYLGQKQLESFAQPKTPGEAKAMRGIDILTLAPLSIGKTKNLGPIIKNISKTEDINAISKELKSFGLADDAIKTTAPKLVKETRPEVISNIINDSRKIEPPIKTTPKEIKTESGIKTKPLDSVIKESKRSKTTIFDYARTPDRVLNKLGLGEQVKNLRYAHENYLKDFQKEVNLISKWKKSVPKESNVRIFKYLDGQNIQLAENEQVVANQIRQHLKDWADKLDLPEEQRVTNYITRIFEDSYKTGQIDEDLAFILNEKLPSGVFNPYELSRTGATGYKEDVWAALDAYANKATRKLNLDEPIKAFDIAETLPTADWDFVKSYLDGVNFRPTKLDTLMDNTINRALSKFGKAGEKASTKLGERPTKKILSPLRAMGYRGTIGGNIGSALKNLSQGINTISVLGEKNTFKGYASLFNKKNVQELIDEGILNYGFIQDRISPQTNEILNKLDDKLFMFFEKAEKINRGAAYFGAKSKALSEGKSLAEAIEYAKEITRKTQFAFGELDTPLFLKSQLAKTAFQLQSFSVKQIEFLTEMALKDKNFAGLLRYAVYGTLFVNTLGQLFGMEMKDLIPGMRLGGGLVLNPVVEGAKSIIGTKDKYGNERDLKQRASDFGKTLLPFVPGGTQIKKTAEGIQSQREGAVYNKGGDLQFTVPDKPFDILQSVLFGKYVSKNAKNYFDKEKINTKNRDKILPTYEKVQKLKAEGKNDEAKAIVDSLSEDEWEQYKEIRSQETSKQTQENKKKVLPTYEKVQKLKAEGKNDEAKAIVDSLSEDEWKAYKLIKTQVEKEKQAAEGVKPQYEEGEPADTDSVIKTVVTYAKALGTDPVTAFNRIFTGQKIRYIANDAIVVERLPLKESQEIKRLTGKDTKEMKLDHTIPLQLGGSNSEKNLKMVPTDIWNTYTPVENAIGKALRDKKIDKKTAQRLITEFKEGKITKDEVNDIIEQ